MKRILFSALILVLNLVSAPAFSREIPIASQSNTYCSQGDKVLDYYQKLLQKSDGQKIDDAKYLTAAKYFYYQANRLDMSNSHAFIGRARIALLENNTKAAKNNLMIALNIDEMNPKVNFWLGETFFKEGEYTKAIDFYYQAYSHGYRYDYQTNLKLGICYEKLDDVKNSKLHYKNAIKINKGSVEANARLQGLDTIDTSYKDYNKLQEIEAQEEEISPEDIENLNMPAL